ncbi:GNAT family N-acetyltransferase [Paenibacillus alvei]|uniref:Uncharacterized N-acetyltransferase YbbJ n=1 Tax=Paenibacillus alvei TaxID=44250 RepID=A0A383RGM9_PAEAL|nr:GNAT family protein [Paenibacillus alvei]SYX86178.1 Uncharacterized N-acetyltransferase YbbJ [Paenibacillus alvei]
MKQVTVELQFYKPAYMEALHSYQLPAEQKQFAAMPNQRLDTSDGQHPIVITAGNQPVGFFVLNKNARVQEYSENPQALLLTSFSIDYAKQGQGYASTGLELLKSFIPEHFPDCNEIVLAVNHKNIPAQRLYIKAGFTDTGQRCEGNIGEQYIFSLSL